MSEGLKEKGQSSIQVDQTLVAVYQLQVSLMYIMFIFKMLCFIMQLCNLTPSQILFLSSRSVYVLDLLYIFHDYRYSSYLLYINVISKFFFFLPLVANSSLVYIVKANLRPHARYSILERTCWQCNPFLKVAKKETLQGMMMFIILKGTMCKKKNRFFNENQIFLVE